MTGGSQNSKEKPRAKTRDPLVGTILDGRFQIEDVLGTGGMSVVYKATQLRVNRHVAIKTLRVQLDAKPIYRERFQREISLLCSLSHPNIVTVYDCVIGEDDQPYVVMDYLRGRSLEQLIEQDGPMSVDRFARIAVQVASALDYAHRKGVIHRDLKPGNIVLLDEEMDFVKVVDFGLAKLNLDNRKLTQSGELWGSPPYMSPEQCTSKPEDERSDIYSFGAVMYEMLTGKDPFHYATTIFELIQTHVLTPPPKLSDANALVYVNPKLESVIAKALAKDPNDRYQSGQQLKDAIVDACADTKSSTSGDLRLLPAQGAPDPAKRWLQMTDESGSPQPTPSANFKLALDPMQGFTVDELFDPTSGVVNNSTPAPIAPGPVAPVDLRRDSSDDPWSNPSYQPAPASVSQSSLPAQAAPPKSDPVAESTQSSPESGLTQKSFEQTDASHKASASSLRNRRMDEAPSKSAVAMLSIIVFLISAGAIFFFSTRSHAPSTVPTVEDTKSPAPEPTAATPAATVEHSPPGASVSSGALEDRSEASGLPHHARHIPSADTHIAPSLGPHKTHSQSTHVQAPVSVHHAPPTVSAPPASHAAGKNPWDALQGLRAPK